MKDLGVLAKNYRPEYSQMIQARDITYGNITYKDDN